MKHLKWFLGLLCWDGLMPLAVFLLPGISRMLFGNGEDLEAGLAVSAPILFFFIRIFVGAARFEEMEKTDSLQRWQWLLFFLALLILMLFEALVIVLRFADVEATNREWRAVYMLYCCYFIPMAIVFFPRSKKDPNGSSKNENPWKSLGHSE